MQQRLFSHHIFRYVILWEAHSEWLSSKTPGCVYNKGDLLKQGWHWEPSGGGIYLESSRALAKLWSALVLYLPFCLSPNHRLANEHCRPRGVTLVSRQQGQAWLQLPVVCRQEGPSLFHYALIISFTMKYGQHIWTIITFPMTGGVFGKKRGGQLNTRSRFDTDQRKSARWI